MDKLDADGLPASEVGAWTEEKHERLRKYVDASHGARRSFQSRSYVDLYCGPARSWLRETGAFIVGFNLLSFDLPFLVTRSFIHQVKILPFNLKSVIDLRDRISAYRYGNTRGTLKEFAALMGLETMGDGGQVAELCRQGDIDGLAKYLRNDLLITDEIFKRARDLNILGIEKW